MKSLLAAVALFIPTLSYLGYLFGSASASSLCEHEWCRVYITCLCTVVFVAMGGFFVGCLVSPTHAPELCHMCCSLTSDAASDATCGLIVDHFV
jgi:hypothetical protein